MVLRYAIASYKRPQCKTVDTLICAGVPCENIYVSLQDDAELGKYKATHPDIQYIVRCADSAAGNRNTLIEAVGAPLVLLDDDITSICIKKQNTNFSIISDRLKWEEEIYSAILHGADNKCGIVGVAPTSNNMIAKRRKKYSYDVLLQGSFLIILDKNIRFDEKWKMCEDYELSLRTILHSHTLRANYISANKPTNGSNQGGLHDRYLNGELEKYIELLEKNTQCLRRTRAKREDV